MYMYVGWAVCRLVEFINQEISEERERSITGLLQLCLRLKKTKLPSMPFCNPVSEYQPPEMAGDLKIK